MILQMNYLLMKSMKVCLPTVFLPKSFLRYSQQKVFSTIANLNRLLFLKLLRSIFITRA